MFSSGYLGGAILLGIEGLELTDIGEREYVITVKDGGGLYRLAAAVLHISTSPGTAPMPSLIATRSAWT